MNTSVRCLYFPYSRTLNIQTLKKSTLLFDEIAFVDTEPHFIRNQLMSELIPETEKEEIEVAYNQLEKEEIIHFLEPSEIIKNNDQLLTLNILNDISDDDFCKIALGYSTDIWNIMSRRIPSSFLKEFYPGVGTFAEAMSVQRAINGSNNDETVNPRGKLLRTRWNDMDEERAWQLFEKYRYVVGGNPHIKLETYRLPFLQASSLRLNEALLLCAMDNYIPFTDSRIHVKLLGNKVSRAMEAIDGNLDLNNYLEDDLPLKLPFQQLSLMVLDKLIPEEELAKRSFEDLINYRKENTSQLYRFRDKVAEIVSAIDMNKSTNYYTELEKIIISKILPEVTKTQDEFVRKYEEAFGRIAVRSVQATGSVLSATTLAGRGIVEILIACAVAQAGVLTTVGANEVVKIWQASRDKSRNSFSYLTNLKR